MTNTTTLTMDASSGLGTDGTRSGHTDTAEKQAFGFWLYLMSDLVLFAALFATYLVLGRNFAGGPTGRELFSLPYVFVETMILLFSSAAYGMAMPAVQRKQKGQAFLWMGITFVLGAAFIVMEFLEFHHLIVEGHTPDRSAFLSAFFTLVGTHGAHVFSGLIWIVVMLFQISAKGLTSPVQSRLVLLGMFWHFLDIVWVGVFTIVYLLGVM